MTSQYLNRPARTEREAELERVLRGLINAVTLTKEGRGAPGTVDYALKRAREVLSGVQDD